MIKVTGIATLKVDFEVELNMTQEEFDALTKYEINDLIDDTVDWSDILTQLQDVDLCDVYDVLEKV